MKFFPKKSLGQNFLTDNKILNMIVELGKIKSNDIVLEVGPGTGNLTEIILKKKPKKLVVVEKDKNLSLILKKKFNNEAEIINDNILNYNHEIYYNKKIIIFGNLPYNISTQIIASLILLKKWPPWYKMLVFMFQKEVADRIIAKNNSKNFGRLSVLCNWRLEIKKHFDVSKNCFFPKPKINSTVLSFQPKLYNKFKIKNPKNLETVTRALFSNRRKMINKNFIKLFKGKKSIANDLNLNLNKRPEELNSEMFYKITIKYEELFC